MAASGIDRPVALIILDGWGERHKFRGNAIAMADTPNYDRLRATCPSTLLRASGAAVGLPDGQIGNSEVGHTTIGAGRVIPMDLPRIDGAISDGSFDDLPALRGFVGRLKETSGAAHLAGLVSNGGVHSHLRHIEHASRVLLAAEVPVRLHAFLDGRDVLPGTAMHHLAALIEELDDDCNFTVATVSGRYWAMDRDNRWDRTERAWRTVMLGQGETTASALEAVKAGYDRGESDEFIAPTSIGGYGGMRDGDGLFSVNFRADRIRQLMTALADPDFSEFDISQAPEFAAILTMAPLSTALDSRMETLFTAQEIHNTLGQWISEHSCSQLRLAETEKYPHVTYFFNGGVETPYPGEERSLVASPKVATYDQSPEMSAPEIGERLVAALSSDSHDFIVANFANPDMVGHTGDFEATIHAIECVDKILGRCLCAAGDKTWATLVTSDHGNAEDMVHHLTVAPKTAHTTNPVPLSMNGVSGSGLRHGGGLADLAPTVLALMGLVAPEEMTGTSLLEAA